MTQYDWQDRTRLLAGDDSIQKLKKASVLIAGLGGVGATAAEFICRAGVGNMTIADHDTVHITNRNRQLPALVSTEGRYKAEVVAERLKDINPELNLTVEKKYLKDEAIPEILCPGFDYVVDAIDTLSPKVFFLFNCVKMGLKVISSLGSGAKYDPLQVRIADISETYNCPLGYYLRKRLHKLGVSTGITAVFSPELTSGEMIVKTEAEQNKKSTRGTISYMPAIFGCFCASVVIREIISVISEQ